MAPTYGPRDTSLLGLPAGWDAGVLQRHNLEDGTSFLAVAQQLNAAVNAKAAEVVGDPLWSSLLSYTDMPAVDEYMQGASNGFGEFTEYGKAEGLRASTTGHMLPLKPYDRRLKWTWYYLEHARMPQVEADIADAVKDMGDLWRVRILTRLLQRGDDSGAAKGLGTGGYSPGFATTAASTDVDFTPPSFGGVTFSSTHEHYVPIAGGAYTTAVFSDIKAELLEHGHLPPYNVIVSSADETAIRALTGFVPVSEMGIAYSTGVSLAAFGPDYSASGYNIGTINDCYVRVVNGMPQYYGFAWKAYGANSQRNPLRVRLPKGLQRPSFRVMYDPTQAGAENPLNAAMIFVEMGVGVGGDRTNGTARYVNNAAWSDGTPT